MSEVASKPDWLLELSQLCGSEWRTIARQTWLNTWCTLRCRKFFRCPTLRPSVVSRPVSRSRLSPRMDCCRHFPHRVGWHSDQSYRRPPPDVALFYAVKPCPQGQGQARYASGMLAYDALSAEQKQYVDSLRAIHAQPRSGYSEAEALSGAEEPKLAAHKCHNLSRSCASSSHG